MCAIEGTAVLDLFGTHVGEGFYRRVALTSEHFLTARKLVASAQSSLRSLGGLHLAVALGRVFAAGDS